MEKSPSEESPKNVYRIDLSNGNNTSAKPTHGWQVRIERHRERYSKFFNDRDFESSEEALQKAIQYRDRLLQQLPDPMDAVRESAKARSKTGVIGLSFSWKNDGGGTSKPYVQLSWSTEDGSRRTAAYSLHKWNPRRAVWKACVKLCRKRQDLEETSKQVQDLFSTALPAVREEYESGHN
jgi:hypothetical protein